MYSVRSQARYVCTVSDHSHRLSMYVCTVSDHERILRTAAPYARYVQWIVGQTPEGCPWPRSIVEKRRVYQLHLMEPIPVSHCHCNPFSLSLSRHFFSSFFPRHQVVAGSCRTIQWWIVACSKSNPVHAAST